MEGGSHAHRPLADTLLLKEGNPACRALTSLKSWEPKEAALMWTSTSLAPTAGTASRPILYSSATTSAR